MKTKSISFILLPSILFVLFFCCVNAKADIIYSNLNDANYNTRWGVPEVNSSIGVDVDIAVSFTPNENYLFDSFILPVMLKEGTNSIDIWLMEDNAGLPGVIIEDFHHVNELNDNPFAFEATPLFVSSIFSPALNAGSKYWLGVSAGADDTYFVWARTNNDLGEFVYNKDSAGWVADEQLRGAFQVNGTLTQVPAPAAAWFFGSGLLGLIGVARKKAV